jgi:hypothetical protein
MFKQTGVKAFEEINKEWRKQIDLLLKGIRTNKSKNEKSYEQQIEDWKKR